MRFSFDISGICCCIPIIALVGLLIFLVLKKQSGPRSHSHSSGVYWGASDGYSASNDSHWSSDSNSGDSSGSWGDSGGSSDSGGDSSD
ncbi:hypothetical protein [Herpetosiphon gulosus]|uniref:Uncharacterized protein n=1 Tax=Herpetosiphon gulosus TaxID=1973496 RepID=A0ABP9X5J3_9CHLR